MAIMLNHDTNKQNITDNTSCNNNNNNNGGTGNNTFYCDICDLTFNKEASFDKHLLSNKHSDSNSNSNSNSKGFIKGFVKEYEQEMPTGTGAEFTCDKCNKTYKYKASFFTHVKNCGKGETGGLENTATTTTVHALSSAASSNILPSSTSPTSDTTLLLVNEIGTMMKTMSQIVTTLDLTIVTLNKMYNNNK
jgi:hypothetical protein